MQRFVEAVAMGDLRDHLRIESPAAAIMAVADIADAGLRMTGANAFAAGAGQRAAPAKFNRGNRLIDRAAGSDLHDKKLMVIMAHSVGITSNRRRIR